MLVKSEPESETFTSDEQRQKFSEALQLIIAENECQLGATTFAKLSLIAFYRQLTRALRSHLIVLHCLEAVLVINFFAFILIYIVGTEPIGCLFNYFRHNEDCVARISMTYVLCASGGVQIFVDLCLLVLPWVVLRKLRVAMSDKVKLTLMYSAGLITLAFSAARIHAVINDNLSTKDWLLSQFSFVTWGTIEAFTAIICVNIPCLVAGFNRWQHRASSSKFHHQCHTPAYGPQDPQDPRRHRLPVTKYPTKHLYEYRLPSSSHMQSTAFYDAPTHDGKRPDTSCIKVTQEFRADIELSQHDASSEDLDLVVTYKHTPKDLG